MQPSLPPRNLYYVKPTIKRTIKCKCNHSIFEDTKINTLQYVSLSEISDLIDVSENMRYSDKVDLFLSYGIDYNKVIKYYDSVNRLERSLHKHENKNKIIQENYFYLMITIIMTIMRLLA